jgi:hypothetical protein
VLQVEYEARIAGELVKERALGPAVALAEWVDGVDLTEVVSETLREGVPGKARLSSCSARKTSAAADSMYCGRQNQVPFAMATVRSCPAQS